MSHKTIFDERIDESDYNFKYQKELTNKLDSISGDFTQEVVNEIVLWKVNRYAIVKPSTIELLNKIEKESKVLDPSLTKQILEQLLSVEVKGIRLPMASTILRFKNPNIYQIIDQRVYRLLNETDLKIPNSIEEQIDLYFKYLHQLRAICISKDIPFEKADRILYEVDKKLNKNIKLKNYG